MTEDVPTTEGGLPPEVALAMKLEGIFMPRARARVMSCLKNPKGSCTTRRRKTP
jgi:hypothetical protein